MLSRDLKQTFVQAIRSGCRIVVFLIKRTIALCLSKPHRSPGLDVRASTFNFCRRIPLYVPVCSSSMMVNDFPSRVISGCGQLAQAEISLWYPVEVHESE